MYAYAFRTFNSVSALPVLPSTTSMSANPFSDSYATSDSSDSPPSYKEHKHDGKVIAFPETVPVPFLDAVSPMRSFGSESNDSSPSTIPNTSPPTSSYGKIEWTNADLNYLLSALYPDQMVSNELFFAPRLESLQDVAYPVRLELYLRIPTSPVPSEAYAVTAPIGTGRPVSKVLVAASLLSSSAALARRSLAERLLGDGSTLRYMVAHYNLLSTLYSLPPLALDSVHRGMVGMARASEPEWYERFIQVTDAGVDSSWGFDARLEAFLLEAGYWELGRWLCAVETAIKLVDEDREHFAGVYFEAGRFLGGVVGSL